MLKHYKNVIVLFIVLFVCQSCQSQNNEEYIRKSIKENALKFLKDNRFNSV